VAPTTAQTPEQVGVLVGGCAHDVAVRGDDRIGHDVVAGEAMLARQPAHAAAQCQPADAGVRDVAGRGGEAEGLRGPVQRAEHRATLHPGAPRDRIDGDPAQPGEVDHEPAVRDSVAGDVVAAATDTDLQVALTGGAHRGDDVADRGATDDQLRAVVDHPIPDRPGGVVPAGAGSEDLTVEVRTANGGGGELRFSPKLGSFG